MTPFEIAIYAALIVIIGVLLVKLRNRQPNASADLAELRGQLAQISNQSGAIQTLIADQMAQSEGRLGTRLEQSLRDQNDRTTKSLTSMAGKAGGDHRSQCAYHNLDRAGVAITKYFVKQTGTRQFW